MRRSLLASFALLLATCPASADVAVEARFFDGLARRAFDAGRYDEALRSFLLASEVAPSPRALYNIALCADLAKNGRVAFAYYREYLRSPDGDAERRRDAVRRFDMLKRSLALVEVTSVPAGARVYTERIELGSQGITPTVVVVAPGQHPLIVERVGYLPTTVIANATEGGIGKVNVELQARLGEVAVHVSPAGAALEFLRDGSRVGATLEHGRYRLPIGPYVVRASAAGYLPTDAQVVLKEGERAELDVAATPLPQPTGKLLVDSPGVVAEVFIDGARAALTPASLSSVAAGPHRVEVRAGRRRWTRSLLVREGHTSFVEVEWKTQR